MIETGDLDKTLRALKLSGMPGTIDARRYRAELKEPERADAMAHLRELAKAAC